MRRWIIVFAIAAWMILAPSVRAWAAPEPTSQPTTLPVTRVLEASITDREATTLNALVSQRLRSPTSPLPVLKNMEAGQPPGKPTPAANETATFDLWIPTGVQVDDDEAELLGVVIYCSPGDGENSVLPPPQYREALAGKRLAWIGARGAGNSRAVPWRIWSAVRAARLAASELPLDSGRVYIAGMSGGGKMACIGGLGFADTFTGTLTFCGPAYFRNLPAAGGVYPAIMPKPESRILTLALKHPFVLFTGDKDFNLAPTQALKTALETDGFSRVTLSVEPDGGHAMPSAEAFGRLLDALDESAISDAPNLMTRAASLEKNNQPGAALRMYRAAVSRNASLKEKALAEIRRLARQREAEHTAIESLSENDAKVRRFRQRWDK